MIRVEREGADGAIATVTLDRPERMNAINPEMYRDLARFWRDFKEDDSLHVAIVTGAGPRAFSTGRDLTRETAVADEQERAQRRVESDGADIAPDRIWKPVIAAINGWCLAGGFALALACDLRIMAAGARIGSMAPKRGLVPGGGQVQRLARYVPFGTALELLLRANHIDAAEAYRIGLVNAVVPPEDLMPTARAWAAEIEANGPLAVRATKQAAYEGALDAQGAFHAGMRLENQLYAEILQTEDAAEGTRAFAQKRPPVYRGR